MQEYIEWARSQGIGVGPGRGSAAGAIVAYAMDITALDPLSNGLLFERFLSPERVEMPDIDVDFEQGRREEVINHIKDVYGEDHVSQVITFGTLQAKNAVRDAARVLDYPYNTGDRICKMIGDELGITIDKALATNPDLKKAYESEEDVKQVIDAAKSLEGHVRGEGVHACATIICRDPMADHVPMKRDTKGGGIITQYDGHYTPELGLLKMDFLGLRTLDVLTMACRNIEQRFGTKVIPEDIPIDDEAAFKLMQSGNMDGLFQVEGALYVSLFSRLPPTRFSDIVASIALNRPGPLESGMVDDYVKVASGKTAIHYYDERLRPILEETYGTMVYQEQIMQISMAMSGFSAGKADKLRKAMGKKKLDVMRALQEDWNTGAVENGFSLEIAKQIWDDAEKFAKYAFNKSHSAAYAILVMRTAYLKAHYPNDFMAAVLSSYMGNTDRLIRYIASCNHSGIPVLPPDINSSNVEFTPVDEGVRFGLVGVRGVGKNVAEEIIAEREANGPFTSLHDFVNRLDAKCYNRKTLEALIKGGAFDSTGYTRKPAHVLRGRDAASGGRLEAPEGPRPGPGVHVRPVRRRSRFGFRGRGARTRRRGVGQAHEAGLREGDHEDLRLRTPAAAVRGRHLAHDEVPAWRLGRAHEGDQVRGVRGHGVRRGDETDEAWHEDGHVQPGRHHGAHRVHLLQVRRERRGHPGRRHRQDQGQVRAQRPRQPDHGVRGGGHRAERRGRAAVAPGAQGVIVRIRPEPVAASESHPAVVSRTRRRGAVRAAGRWPQVPRRAARVRGCPQPRHAFRDPGPVRARRADRLSVPPAGQPAERADAAGSRGTGSSRDCEDSRTQVRVAFAIPRISGTTASLADLLANRWDFFGGGVFPRRRQRFGKRGEEIGRFRFAAEPLSFMIAPMTTETMTQTKDEAVPARGAASSMEAAGVSAPSSPKDATGSVRRTALRGDTPVRNHTLGLTVSYNGAPFSGFARQPGQLTVQGEIEQALALLFKRDVETTCAGRTDAGVHALGQVMSFDVDDVDLRGRSLPSLRRSLNALTHDAITVREVEPKPLGFSARFDAQAREYHYHLCVDSTSPIFMKDFSWFVPGGLDVFAMEAGARHLIGEHDFKSFCLAASAEGKPTHRNVREISFHPETVMGENILAIKVVGNAFLHSMVRTMVGTLVMVGKGQREPDWVREVLQACDRQAAGENAPAQGLVFWRVIY